MPKANKGHSDWDYGIQVPLGNNSYLRVPYVKTVKATQDVEEPLKTQKNDDKTILRSVCGRCKRRSPNVLCLECANGVVKHFNK